MKKNKVVWFECTICKAQYRDTVMCEIEPDRLVPVCIKCGAYLTRRSEKSD